MTTCPAPRIPYAPKPPVSATLVLGLLLSSGLFLWGYGILWFLFYRTQWQSAPWQASLLSLGALVLTSVFSGFWLAFEAADAPHTEPMEDW